MRLACQTKPILEIKNKTPLQLARILQLNTNTAYFTFPRAPRCSLVAGVCARLKMASIRALNPHADIVRKSAALAVNIGAAKSLQEIMKSNLGPLGTMKMY
jgi:hypothetical protein